MRSLHARRNLGCSYVFHLEGKLIRDFRDSCFFADGYTLVTLGKNMAFPLWKVEAVNLLILLVPEVGIPSIDSGQAHRTR
jgi:hypothetical protein